MYVLAGNHQARSLGSTVCPIYKKPFLSSIAKGSLWMKDLDDDNDDEKEKYEASSESIIRKYTSLLATYSSSSSVDQLYET